MKPLHFLTVLFLFCLLLSGCGTTKYVPLKETEYVRDTVILKADTVRMTIPVEKIVEVVPQFDTLRMETSVAKAMAYAEDNFSLVSMHMRIQQRELSRERLKTNPMSKRKKYSTPRR